MADSVGEDLIKLSHGSFKTMNNEYGFALTTSKAYKYNDAYTTMNDNGATLYRERTRAVDMIMHIEDLVNSIATRPKDFDTNNHLIYG